MKYTTQNRDGADIKNLTLKEAREVAQKNANEMGHPVKIYTMPGELTKTGYARKPIETITPEL